MSFADLVNHATDKERFHTVEQYYGFDALLSQHIKTIDHFFYADLWALLNRHGPNLGEIAIQQKEIP